MSMTQFAMVEELAFLIKDNIPCKHLVLSIEESLVNLLQNDMSPDRILELEPMNAYNRLLVHRLADIFGFAHESVGGGDDRHIILERCPESSIPSILVSDVLWQFDEYHSPTTSHQLLRRKEELPALNTKPTSFPSSFEEREAAYLAARERIFSVSEIEIKESVTQKPRNIPVVARRMIAHALGQRISTSNQEVTLPINKENGGQTEEFKNREKDKNGTDSSPDAFKETDSLPSQDLSSTVIGVCDKPIRSIISSPSERKNQSVPSNKKSFRGGVSESLSTGYNDNLKQEHLGAAKRMFAHALGLQSAKENHSTLLKCTGEKKVGSRS